MAEIGKYIYGIIDSNSDKFSDHCWILENEGIYSVSYQDVSAIVSDSEIIDYTGLRKDILAKQLVKHQKIIEGIMPEYSIIPVKLGTVAIDDEVKEILANGYKLIKEIFTKISGKIELDVVAIWSDFTSVIKEAGEEKEIKEYKEKLLNSPKGITVDDQMKVGFMLKKALDELRQNYANQIKYSLKEFMENFRDHELMDDKMVVNYGFLIDKTKEKEFYARIEALNKELLEKLNFRCVGPLPAYSFFTLEIKKLQFNAVDWARKKLGILNDAIAKDEIKKAFHKQLLFSHPDKNPNSPGIDMEFDEIKRSYNILLDYACACEQVGLPAPRLDVFCVYAIRCNNESLYIGHTDDLRKRYQEHVKGTAAQWTKKHKPLYIAHYEEYNSREEAVKREKELKTGFGRKWLKREIEAGRARQAGQGRLIFNEDEFRRNAVLVKVRE